MVAPAGSAIVAVEELNVVASESTSTLRMLKSLLLSVAPVRFCALAQLAAAAGHVRRVLPTPRMSPRRVCA